MTKQQIKRLCDIDPENFFYYYGYFWDVGTNPNTRIGDDPIEDMACIWWMLQQMRAAWEPLEEAREKPDFSPTTEYTSLLTSIIGADCFWTEGQVVEGYIAWRESQESNKP